jgi:2-methylisocitrate lyase-like PEP mutase family enzyme
MHPPAVHREYEIDALAPEHRYPHEEYQVTMNRADLFFSMHAAHTPVVLASVWDAGSARLLERCGAQAIAISTAGIAWSLGYPRDERLPPHELVDPCARICSVTHVPLVVDLGVASAWSADELRTTVRSLLDLGIVGIDIAEGAQENENQTTAQLCEHIVMLRALAAEMNARVFLNARIDCYAAAKRGPARRAEASRRAQAYAAAGADGIFIPGLDAGDMVPFARAQRIPVGVDVADGWAPAVHGLARAGIRRVMLGDAAMRSALTLFHDIAREAIDRRSYHVLNKQAGSARPEARPFVF